MSNVPYGMWAEYLTKLAALHGRPIQPAENLLDLATGTGSIALQFAARGCRVTGVDASAPMIEEAQRKAAEHDLDAKFLCADLTEFRHESEFDHAVCLYDSLNYILDADRLEQAFANIRAALKPAGLLIFDVNTTHALECELFTQKSAPGAAIKYDWKSKYDRKTRISRVKMSFQVTTTGERFSIVHRQRAYTEVELRSLLSRAGFAEVTSYDAYSTTPPGSQSDRVFYVAHPADEQHQAPE